MKISKIKPVPKYIIAKIKKFDKVAYPKPSGNKRFYSYLTTNDKELVKVTVAVRHKGKEWYYKQCAVHGIHSKDCFVKDMTCYYICGFVVGWHYEGLERDPKWFENGIWDEAYDKYFDPFAPVVNRDYITKFPEYRYSALELYNGIDILHYLRVYEKYPQAEYLVKAGLSKYAKNTQILKKIEKDKKFCRWISRNKEELKNGDYYISSIMRAYEENTTLKSAQAYERAKKTICRERDFKPIRDMLNNNYEKYFAYIGKQNITNRLYLDYWKACDYLGLNMDEEKNRYPHDFNRWHDIRIDEYNTAKALKDAEERKELYSKFSLIAEKYSSLQYDKRNDYVAIIAKTPAELIKEGDTLHHCVGRMGYDQKYIREESLIFFIRSKDTPDKPYVTAEYSPKNKKILQCYADGNKKPDDAVIQYVDNIWLPYANRMLRQISV